MAGITATTGLVSGIATQDTIDKLMQIAARPRDLLISRNKEAQTEQAALSQVQAMILAMQVNVQKLTKSDTFNKTKATSSDDKIMTVLATRSPTAGSYSFRGVVPRRAGEVPHPGPKDEPRREPHGAAAPPLERDGTSDPRRGLGTGEVPGDPLRRTHDSLVEGADQFRRQVLVDRHPEAFLNLLNLHGHLLVQGGEAADEVDVRLPIAVAVPVTEAHERVKATLDTRLFLNLA